MTTKDLHSLKNARSRQMGAAFENLINASCEYYKNAYKAVIEKTPEPMRTLRPLGNGRFEAVYTKQAQPDYKGTLYGGKAIVFEAKHTDTDRIKLSAVSDEQWFELQYHSSMGAECYVLVSFGLKRFYKFPWNIFMNMRTYFGHAHIKETDNIAEYEIKFTGCRLEFL